MVPNELSWKNIIPPGTNIQSKNEVVVHYYRLFVQAETIEMSDISLKVIPTQDLEEFSFKLGENEFLEWKMGDLILPQIVKFLISYATETVSRKIFEFSQLSW